MLASDVLAECQVDVASIGGVGELAAVVARRGVAVFNGVPNEHALLRLGARLGVVVPHRDSAATGITVISDRRAPAPQPGRAGFTSRGLAPHTDCSDRPQPPQIVVMACTHPGDRGGESVLVDGQAVYAELATVRPDALADLSAARGAYFGGAAGLVGNVFEPGPTGLISLRLRLDELVRFAPSTQRWLPLLRQIIDRHTLTVTLPAGGGYVLNNRRWLHGRHGFTGQRVMRRLLLQPHPAWHIPRGFTPPEPHH